MKWNKPAEAAIHEPVALSLKRLYAIEEEASRGYR